MQDKDWHGAWKNGQTGWHRDHISPSLLRHAHHLKLARGDTLLVPLCGASHDMHWAWQQGWHVTGVDISKMALQTFITHHQLNGQWQGQRFVSDRLTLIAADILEVPAEDLGQTRAIYDRASLIALPPAARLQYIQHLRAHCPSGTPFLSEVLSYDPPCPGQPPYSVCERQWRHTLGFTNGQQLDKQPAHDVPPRLQNRNTHTQVFFATL